jgi:hypothetical protein
MSDKIIKKTQYINMETGVVEKENTQYIAAAFHEEKGYLFWARKNFAKSFIDVEFPAAMTMKERGQMATLAKYMWSNTNMLGYRGSGGVKPYNEERIGNLIGLKAYQAKDFMRNMIGCGMIAKVIVTIEDEKTTQYYINPIYFFGSNRISLNLYLIFRTQLDEVLPLWVLEKYAAVKGAG